MATPVNPLDKLVFPPEIDAVVQKMGAKDPAARYQSAAEVVNALHTWLPVAEWAELSVTIGPKLAERKAAEADMKQKEAEAIMKGEGADSGGADGTAKPGDQSTSEKKPDEAPKP